ncbi:heavy metal translocating P-type ATPase [Liquorilactobacillus cacaonum]|uniref:P-type Cu(+) transporter n=1 Tax=Liquorilactobacillus cacaonum DSM 21116 TaxID=1423729 RepID=A0A0R2CEI8_9LACO|nr:heavy metal translocating P-type ATPase [Liquorilactobacillus cacaonum]KRM90174.1 copper-transporting P-type ATPase [Liquorilactobacillus cacaonum DSM 21116]
MKDNKKIEHDMSKMDHNKMNHEMPEMDHSKMNHEMSGHMHHMGDFKKKFWLSFVVSLPIFLLSSFMGLKLPFNFSFTGSDWLVLVLATFLFFYGGQPFYTGAWQELKERTPAMMTLITMGISVAYIYSLYAFVINHFVSGAAHVMDFFWELASLIVIMLLGHWIEMNATMSAGNAVEKMAALLPGEAHLLGQNGRTQDIKLEDLEEGQVVKILAGEKVPADGEIISGTSAVNEALVTGESKAVKKRLGDKVIGGSLNGDGTLVVKVTGTGQSGYLAQVSKLVGQAQQDKSKAESVADRVSKWLFYAALLVGIIAFLVWLNLADMSTALNRMVAVLVIACPHALGLAIPLVVARSTSLAATNGLLLRNRKALEQVKKLDVVLMDKTGTLTEGIFKVNEIKSENSQYTKNEVLELMAQLETSSSHPLATGILNEAKKNNLDIKSASNVQTLKGIGVTGLIAGKEYQLVTANYLKKKQIDFNQKQFDELAQKGNSISYLISDEKIIGLIAQGDQIKNESKTFIEQLHQMGIEPVMLTGDNELAAKKIATQLGKITVKAELKPEDKERIVREYQEKNHHVMMLGDGVNDAPSLARADIGVAIGAGTDVAIDSADVVLVKSNPKDVLNFLHLAKATNRKMVENLWWGAGYNILALPLAAGLLAGFGFVLSPAVGAIVMSLSTVIVAINAMTLRID